MPTFPKYLDLRDTELNDDLGGLGQHIWTTAGQGYEKRRYVREDYYQEKEKRIEELEALAKLRGERMGLMRLWMQRTMDDHPPYRTIWSYFEKEYKQTADWFDKEGKTK